MIKRKSMFKLASSCKHENEKGITLVELLIYLVITAFLSLGISRLISDAAIGLERATDESITAREVIRFTNLIRFDFSGSTDAFVNPSNANMCSYTLPAGSSASNLFTVKIRNISSAQSTSFDDFLSYSYVTYILTRSTSNINSYLARVTCDSISGPSRVENLINLGKISSPPTGFDVLKCDLSNCPINATTADYKTYQLNLPYSGMRLTLRNLTTLANSQLQTLTRKVDEV